MILSGGINTTQVGRRRPRAKGRMSAKQQRAPSSSPHPPSRTAEGGGGVEEEEAQ